jgi:hypothetical protein
MARRAGMYKSNKRQKELKRKKKQEEKMLRRQRNAGNFPQDPESKDSVNIQPEASEDSVEETSTHQALKTAT